MRGLGIQYAPNTLDYHTHNVTMKQFSGSFPKTRDVSMSGSQFGSISGQNVIAAPQVSGDGVLNVNFCGGESLKRPA